MSFFFDTTAFADGDAVTWRQQHRGGYGYVTPVDGTVVGRTEKRVQLRVYSKGGETRYIWVNPKSLTRRLSD